MAFSTLFKRLAVLTILSCSAALSPALAQKQVDSASALKRAAASVSLGETIEIAPGRYDLTDLKIDRDVTLRGGGDRDSGVIFFSSRPVAKGLLNPLSGVSIRVENITFEGAVSPDKNGAGIRHDGDNLTVVNCVFKDNENGILATGGDAGRIRIRGTSFVGNGHGDGYSHGIYVVRAAVLEISESVFFRHENRPSRKVSRDANPGCFFNTRRRRRTDQLCGGRFQRRRCFDC